MSRFGRRWLASDPAATALLPRAFDDPERRIAAVQSAAKPLDAGVLRLLTAQNPRAEVRLRGMHRTPVAFVVTGQQLGFLLGPLYTFLKALTAIRVARELEHASGIRCLPLFWLQTEDHDFDEVASTSVFDDDDVLHSVGLEDAPRRVSIAHRRVPTAAPNVLSHVEELIRTAPYKNEATHALLEPWATPGTRWVVAFSTALSRVFAGDDLLILDPRTPAAAPLVAPWHRKAIFEIEKADEALHEAQSLLHDAGFESQVGLRPGTSLSFFHHPEPAAPRYRLESTPTGFRTPHRTFRRDEIAAAFDKDPLAFSTSALLRPLVQDSLLPTAAHVVGPGEISYLAQLPALRKAWGVEPPLVVPRIRATFIDQRVRRRLQALEIDLSTALHDDADRIVLGDASRLTRDDLHGKIETWLTEVIPAELAQDPAVEKALRRTKKSIERNAGRFLDRVRWIAARREGTRLERLEGIRARVRPEGTPQERVVSLVSFVARFGLDHLKAAVFEACDPWRPLPYEIDL